MKAVSLLVFVLSVMMMAVNGHPQEEPSKPMERWANKQDEMQFCLEQENVTETELSDFLNNGKTEDVGQPLKMVILCFLKKINFFDGVSWNREVITLSEESRPRMLKLIMDCLEKDNVMLPPQERTYQAQKCVLENGTID